MIRAASASHGPRCRSHLRGDLVMPHRAQVELLSDPLLSRSDVEPQELWFSKAD
jgi:hypothetical protein